MDKKGFAPGVREVIIVVLTLSMFMLIFQSCTKSVEEDFEGGFCHTTLNAQKLGVQSLTGEMVMKACTTINKPLIDDEVLDPEGIKHEISMNIARAWKITHEGTIGEEMWKTDLINIFKNGQECMVIYKLTFQPTPLFETSYPGFSYQDLDLYFSSEYFASFPRTDGKDGDLRYTFGEYIQSKAGKGAYVFPDENGDGMLNEMIKPGEIYAISVGSPNSALFKKSSIPTDSNLVMFSTYKYALGNEMRCREFVD